MVSYINALNRVLLKNLDNRESLIAIECINAINLNIWSFLILTGAIIIESWINNNLSNNMLLTVANTSYSNDWLSLQWLKYFHTHSAMLQKKTYKILLINDYGSYYIIEFIEYCEKNKIIPFNLSTYITHLLQSLDVIVF